MSKKKNSISSQIRLSEDMHNYIRKEAERMSISQNAFLVTLLENGKKLWEADISCFPRQE